MNAEEQADELRRIEDRVNDLRLAIELAMRCIPTYNHGDRLEVIPNSYGSPPTKWRVLISTLGIRVERETCVAALEDALIELRPKLVTQIGETMASLLRFDRLVPPPSVALPLGT